MNGAPLEVRLGHTLGGFALHVAFTAGTGVTALFGRSGAGKSTVIRALAGLLRPQTGSITLHGRVLTDTAAGIALAPHKRRVGVVFQDGRLFPHLSVAGNLRFAERFAGTADRRERARIIALLGLDPLLERRPATLSGGEAQRVAIARALFGRPALLCLDEPLAALDAARRAEVLPYLERLKADGGPPMIYVSHQVAEVARLADTVVLMREGRSVAAGPVSQIFAEADAGAALGPRDAGAIVAATVAEQTADGLTVLFLSRGLLTLPAIAAPVGARVLVRLRASDIMLALERPAAISASTVLPAVVAAVRAGEGPGALVTLDSGADRLLVRITQRAVSALGLAPGKPCFAIHKAVAVAPDDIIVPGSARPVGNGARAP